MSNFEFDNTKIAIFFFSSVSFFEPVGNLYASPSKSDNLTFQFVSGDTTVDDDDATAADSAIDDPAPAAAAAAAAAEDTTTVEEKEEDDEEAMDETPISRAEMLKEAFSKALVRKFSPTPRAVAAAIVEECGDIVTLKKWSKSEDAEGLKEVSARALQKMNQKEADSWMESMEDLKRVLNETLLKVEGMIEMLKNQELEKASQAIEDFEKMDEVPNFLISEAMKALHL
tara:strand:+ start:1783 stop:2466 length:684 start_codon:yes stop_codon:yes gene_type:complete